jgi:hypothetical protein|tara:strand:+ start:216 stop:494 length:279 start_codon:yes stop_codon:yes gene_type:complete
MWAKLKQSRTASLATVGAGAPVAVLVHMTVVWAVAVSLGAEIPEAFWTLALVVAGGSAGSGMVGSGANGIRHWGEGSRPTSSGDAVAAQGAP